MCRNELLLAASRASIIAEHYSVMSRLLGFNVSYPRETIHVAGSNEARLKVCTSRPPLIGGHQFTLLLVFRKASELGE